MKLECKDNSAKSPFHNERLELGKTYDFIIVPDHGYDDHRFDVYQPLLSKGTRSNFTFTKLDKEEYYELYRYFYTPEETRKRKIKSLLDEIDM